METEPARRLHSTAGVGLGVELTRPGSLPVWQSGRVDPGEGGSRLRSELSAPEWHGPPRCMDWFHAPPSSVQEVTEYTYQNRYRRFTQICTNHSVSGSSSQYWEITLSGLDLLELKDNMNGMK